ncbi:hypothetical protein RR48_13318 [Papilio machaon]|uniref:Uncharacterized protein n=1 Tax=Papilio machaon TaxID=76193 RepID=A0A194QWK0_PAPMA|nr:hypothetical protein RR48_13318 [Papilio machaon]
MATLAIINAAPTTEPTAETTTDVAVPLVEYIEVIEFVPDVVDLITATEQKGPTTTTEETTHKVAKRSLPFNPGNGLLSDFEGGKNEESDLVGRIRVLPSWVGK